MTDSSWSTVPGQRQATTVTPDSIRTETNQVNNQYQLLEDEVSESESESTSIDDSVPGLGRDTSSSSEDTDGPPALEEVPLEEIRPDLAAAWIPAVIIELARLQVAGLIDTGVVQLFQPPPQRQRIIVNPRFENPQAEIHRAIAQEVQYQLQAPPRPIYTTTRLGTVVRVFGGDDDTVGTVESDDSMSSSEILPSIDVHLPSEMKILMAKYNFADFIVYKEQLGNTLALCQHATRECGHSPLVDTLERHRERSGDGATIALPPPDLRPTIPRSHTSGGWRRYEVEQKMHLQEQHWNNEAIKVTERVEVRHESLVNEH
jgi:hypothetical protein